MGSHEGSLIGSFAKPAGHPGRRRVGSPLELEPLPARPLVSVVISSYNYARYLPDCIDSALAQTYNGTEVIVVDDGSTDESRSIIAGYGSRIVSVLKPNGGLASAVNAGMAAAKGDITAWLDADDLFAPAKVARIVAAFLARPNAVMVYHRLQIIDSKGAAHHRPWPRDVWSGDLTRRIERSGGWWPRPTTSAMAFRRALLWEVAPMPEGRVVDGAVFPDAYVGDLAPFCGEIVGLPEALSYYRVHPDSMSHLQDGAARIRQNAFERRQLEQALYRLGIEASLGPLERHLGYVRCRAEVHGSWPTLLSTIATCPLLRPTTRVREAAKLLLKRGRRLDGHGHGQPG